MRNLQKMCVFSCLLLLFFLCSCARQPVPDAPAILPEEAASVIDPTVSEPVSEETAEAEDPWQVSFDLGQRQMEAENFEEALASFENAIASDNTKSEAYVKAASCCVYMEDVAHAVSLLEDGLAATGDSALESEIASVKEDWNARPIFGTLFLPGEEYSDELKELMDKYPDINGSGRSISVACDACGIRFPETVRFYLDGALCETNQAGFTWNWETFGDLYPMISETVDYKTVPGELTGKTLLLTGYFTKLEHYVRVGEPEEHEYADGSKDWRIFFNPCGEYVFHMESYEIQTESQTG